MGYAPAAKNLMLNALGTALDSVSLHTGDPGTTGANEVAGGSPAYARKTIAFNAASGGSMDDSSTPLVFDIPAGTTVTHAGYWDGATFMVSDPVTNEAFTGQGTYTLTDVDLDLNA